ncbi:bifunctional diaminohydroxyphosphoribosylaminopyrimidine deaminase/5-amino-6-(5-phosphoribosylamino)uracil reductase RibD [Neomicrococcus aestuarii]|uniref:Riboflavin biosynthesis protein RibD n=1 Tax=Neomicrococcus aestuarii TaxID=556325 RepID=A0A1L2ZKT5_9MICC|nr:bifunctional diaminohydroxyphosphoribosylaminopyrimidine deaminase/5-amino-6-(5-phosphoribosylamino)uracil reductase RibD [Neomicrococcus aestuarii]APF39807.1 riboflavin biosynthesis protein RibD [Neomicrococcus aestuarii]
MSFPLTAESTQQLLDAALEQAKNGVRGVNPLVGAVIADAQGDILATGFHRGAGTPHAEADALHNLAQLLGKALTAGQDQTIDPATLTMFVTLEPCNHFGRTGPCSHAIVDAGIGRVVYAVADATDHAAGGASYLKEHGVKVMDGEQLNPEWARASRELNARWFQAQNQQRPFTTLHLAQTLDSNIAASDGTSQWITGAESREHSHVIRSRADAIIVGTGTIVADNPQLTARDSAGELYPKQPVRVAMGLREIPADARIRDHGEFMHLPTRDPAEVLEALTQKGISHAMIEGGSSIATAFLAADLVDEIWLYQAPKLLGSGISALKDLGISTLSEALEFELDDVDGPAVRQLGTDVLLHLTPRNEK